MTYEDIMTKLDTEIRQLRSSFDSVLEYFFTMKGYTSDESNYKSPLVTLADKMNRLITLNTEFRNSILTMWVEHEARIKKGFYTNGPLIEEKITLEKSPWI